MIARRVGGGRGDELKNRRLLTRNMPHSTRSNCSWALLTLVAVAHSAYVAPSTRSGHRRAPQVALVSMNVAPPPELLELKEELLELIDEEVVEGSRGVGAPAEVATDILEVITELDDDGRGALEWDLSPALAGTWRLIYTSSRTFANNEGLSGYARDLAGVATPELLMSIESKFRRITYEEPLELQEGSFASLVGRFAGAESVKVECVWSATSAGVLAVQSQRVVVGDKEWEPADRQDKAVRALGAGRPILLDEELLVLRSEPDYIVWVFERV